MWHNMIPDQILAPVRIKTSLIFRIFFGKIRDDDIFYLYHQSLIQY